MEVLEDHQYCTRAELERVHSEERFAHMKYPEAIQLVWLLEFKTLPMIERATASVVWSTRATKSTIAQARNI